MTPLYRWIVDLFNTLAAWYYRRKYGVAARQLGRPTSPPQPFSAGKQAEAPPPDRSGTATAASEALQQSKEGGQPGVVILEIDGLGYPYLHQAMRAGKMP